MADSELGVGYQHLGSKEDSGMGSEERGKSGSEVAMVTMVWCSESLGLRFPSP